jgi:hypothetical protein
MVRRSAIRRRGLGDATAHGISGDVALEPKRVALAPGRDSEHARGVRRVFLSMIAVAAACRGETSSMRAPQEPLPCTTDHLARFDPGMAVEARSLLPPMEQALADQTTVVAAIECGPGETDTACQRRAEAELAATHSEAAVSSHVVADRVEIAARMTVDGRTVEAIFPSARALEQHLSEHAAAGREVKLEEATARPAAEAKRHAIVQAASPARGNARRTLRISLVVAPQDDPVGALLSLQLRAADSGIALHLVQPRDDGAIEVELGCVVVEGDGGSDETPAR